MDDLDGVNSDGVAFIRLDQISRYKVFGFYPAFANDPKGVFVGRF
ncbi:hypothetical protein ABEV92_10995 [Peribacillus muralis]|nr:hypothetical protein [Peribacillus muralis]